MARTEEKTPLPTFKCNVTRRLNELILEPEEADVAMQQLCKHVPAATNKRQKILLGGHIHSKISQAYFFCKIRKVS
jgi:hypothetical protein